MNIWSLTSADYYEAFYEVKNLDLCHAIFSVPLSQIKKILTVSVIANLLTSQCNELQL